MYKELLNQKDTGRLAGFNQSVFFEISLFITLISRIKVNVVG